MHSKVIAGILAFGASVAWAEDAATPAEPYLRDRGPGIASSMFGTYISPGEVIIYPYVEYYRDKDYEYAPIELGGTLDRDFRGKYRATEALLFFGYGVSDRLALEFEAAIIEAQLDRDPTDDSGTPDRIEESGLGDVEGQIRWRWSAESATRPEIFSYFETVFPSQDEGSLIGTTDWELKLGQGISRGYRWGTLTARLAIGYDNAESSFEMGESAVEYLRRFSPRFSLFGGVEGAQDEYELITEAQVHLSPRATLKLNNAFGLTSKATDWAPEVGILFRL